MFDDLCLPFEARIRDLEGLVVPVGELDITLYRDDLPDGEQAVVRGSDIPFGVTGRRIVLVDDVLYTGRTARAALDGLVDFGRPKRIELLALIDRGLRELPIQADYVGKSLMTGNGQTVRVRLHEQDGEDAVLVGEQRRASAGARGA